MTFDLIYGATTITTDDTFRFLARDATIKVTAVATPLIEVNGATNVEILIRGEGVSTTDAGLSVDGASSDATLRIAAHGKLSGATYGAVFLGPDAAVMNHGTLHGGVAGVGLGSAGGTLTNTGRISGGTGVSATGAGIDIENAGRIHGTGVGVSLENGGDSLGNTGRIVGADIGVFLGDDAALVNAGRIIGQGLAGVQGSNNGQTVFNTGLIKGNVMLQAGDDTYYAQEQGLVTGDILLGIGNDIGYGANGVDRIYGGDGNDFLVGRGGDDLLHGDAGADVMLGFAGKDVLRGGDGDDHLAGLQGKDKLFGGAGADLFGVDASFANGREIIKDWEDGTDLLDLSPLMIAGPDQAQFVADAVSNKHGNAYVDLSFAGASGVMVVKNAAHDIDIGDFMF